MALKFTDQLAPAAVVYDCKDELSALAGAPAELTALGRELLGPTAKVDVAALVVGPNLHYAERQTPAPAAGLHRRMGCGDVAFRRQPT
jgi:hypothetical protein